MGWGMRALQESAQIGLEAILSVISSHHAYGSISGGLPAEALAKILLALLRQTLSRIQAATAGSLRTKKASTDKLYGLPAEALAKAGGAEQDRTVDLLNAIQALSQLSYSPIQGDLL
jgi:hypothetical protein